MELIPTQTQNWIDQITQREVWASRKREQRAKIHQHRGLPVPPDPSDVAQAKELIKQMEEMVLDASDREVLDVLLSRHPKHSNIAELVRSRKGGSRGAAYRKISSLKARLEAAVA